MGRTRAALIWGGLAAAICVPLALAATSPFLAYRGTIYIVAGFAGIVALALTLVQPLLIGGYLPALAGIRGRRAHRWSGGALVVVVALHVGGLWFTSPPEMADALLFRSPTPFAPWGVIAMWAVFATALLAAFRKRLRLTPRTWRFGHMLLAVILVVGGVVHGLLIEGSMETISKVVLCVLALMATAKVIFDRSVSRARVGGARPGA